VATSNRPGFAGGRRLAIVSEIIRMPSSSSNSSPTPRPRASGTVLQPNQRRSSSDRRSIIPSFSESFGSFLLEVAKVVIISLAIIIPIRYFLIQPFYVKGESMEPNFYDSEYLVIDEISYRFHMPNRGDVVVIRNPQHESDFLIKRVIGLPGDRIEIINGEVNVFSVESPSGVTLEESVYLPAGTRTLGTYDVQLGPDEYYVLGDNREESLDSRVFGPIVRREIIGRAWIRAWPVTRLSIFSTPSYTVSATEGAE